jgi:coenzyme F420-reducing hydrogenase delta subunit
MTTHLEVNQSIEGLDITDKFFLAVPEFKKVIDKYDSSVMIFVVCLYDYWSPYRNLEYDERVIIVSQDIMGDKNAHKKLLKEETIKIAAKKYRDLQYDPILDSYTVISKKVKIMNEVIDMHEVGLENIKNLQDAIKGNEKINEMMMKMQDHIKDMQRKSPFRGFSNIEDYHNY